MIMEHVPLVFPVLPPICHGESCLLPFHCT